MKNKSMSCNLPNLYGNANVFGIPRGGEFLPAWSSIVGGLTGSLRDTDRDYEIGYGVGPGHTIEDLVYPGPPRTQVALGSYYWDQIDNEIKEATEQAKKETQGASIATAIVLFGIVTLVLAVIGIFLLQR